MLVWIEAPPMTEHQLYPCPSCGRHVQASSPKCLYCGTVMPADRPRRQVRSRPARPVTSSELLSALAKQKAGEKLTDEEFATIRRGIVAGYGAPAPPRERGVEPQRAPNEGKADP